MFEQWRDPDIFRGSEENNNHLLEYWGKSKENNVLLSTYINQSLSYFESWKKKREILLETNNIEVTILGTQI